MLNPPPCSKEEWSRLYTYPSFQEEILAVSRTDQTAPERPRGEASICIDTAMRGSASRRHSIKQRLALFLSLSLLFGICSFFGPEKKSQRTERL